MFYCFWLSWRKTVVIGAKDWSWPVADCSCRSARPPQDAAYSQRPKRRENPRARRRRAKLSFSMGIVIVVDVELRVIPTCRGQSGALRSVCFAHVEVVGRQQGFDPLELLNRQQYETRTYGRPLLRLVRPDARPHLALFGAGWKCSYKGTYVRERRVRLTTLSMSENAASKCSKKPRCPSIISDQS